MGFERVSLLLAQERSVPSADEWDAARSEEFGIVGRQANRTRPYDVVPCAIREMHWVSLACFLEQCSPTELALHPELAARVTIEYAQLQAFDSLEAYAVSLEQLCLSDSTDTQDDRPADARVEDASH